MVEVTIDDVRVALNEISQEELADATIQQKIDDANEIADEKGLSGFNRKRFVRAWAALKSFIVSNTYTQADFGDIEVRRAWETILEQLEQEVKDSLIEADAMTGLVIESTPMFDDRPTPDE